MSFSFDPKHLGRLAELNGFPMPEEGMVFFGLRGCVPLLPEQSSWAREHRVDVATVDYTHPRCTLGQWRPADGMVAIFPGSTVPYIDLVRKSAETKGAGTNQLLTGFYRDYRKGIHKAGSSTAHEAFRQVEFQAIRRTADDLDFDTDDPVEYMNPYDNIHAAWSMGVNHDHYSSAGCQVVVGYPKCAKPGRKANEGPWKTFHDNAYEIDQQSFPYMLLEGRDLQRVVDGSDGPLTPRLRFGSQGKRVEALQAALRGKGFYEGKIDGDFRGRTLRAVLAYQTARFGPRADDGIVGPITASALGLDVARAKAAAMRPTTNGSRRTAVRLKSGRVRRRQPAHR